MNESPGTSPSNEPKVVELSAQTFFIPISIIIAGIIIAGAIFISGGKSTAPVEISPVAEGDLIGEALGEAQNVTVSVDDDAVLGTKEVGKIAIVEFSDYECPFCKSFKDQTLSQIKTDLIDSGEAFLVFRDLPLPFHEPVATEEAIAAECVRDQLDDKAYFAFHDALFDNTGTNGIGVGDGNLVKLAKEVGANESAFNTCMKEEKFADEVAKDAQDAQAAGINGTPGFVVGKYTEDGMVDGVVISGAQPFAVFKSAVEEVKNR